MIFSVDAKFTSLFLEIIFWARNSARLSLSLIVQLLVVIEQYLKSHKMCDVLIASEALTSSLFFSLLRRYNWPDAFS